MKNTLKITLALTLLLLTAGNKISQAKQTPVKGKTYVIVHGAWGGGWAFRQVDSLLTAQGHKVYRPTLTGLGERVHLGNPDVGLDTHINDVVNTVLFEELDDIVLVGHSYGGMVITGVADRIPERISHVIYLDAFVPEDDKSFMDIVDDKDKGWLTGSAKNGHVIPMWVSKDQAPPKDVPHPLKTLTDTISLKNPDRLKLKTDYILTVDPGKELHQDDFYPFMQRAKALGWPTQTLSADHNAQWSNPKGLTRLLTKIPK